MTADIAYAVTGAFSFSGKHIARRLLDEGKSVITLTRRPERAGDKPEALRVFPLDFDKPDEISRSLEGAHVLFNTTWVRFEHKGMTFKKAYENTRVLFDAAKRAGVSRIVHLSVTNASEDSSLPYFRYKALAEKALIESGLSHAIIRPALIYGGGNVLINNIAWFLRKFPMFGVFGSRRCRVRPIFIGDLAKIAVKTADETGNTTIDAVGPDTFTLAEKIRMIGRKTGGRALIMRFPAPLAYIPIKFFGYLVGDKILTWDEIRGLNSGLLATNGPATGETRLEDWLDEHAESVGRNYQSDLKKHF